MIHDVLAVVASFSSILMANVKVEGIVHRIQLLLGHAEQHSAVLVISTKDYTTKKKNLKKDLLRDAKLIFAAFKILFAEGKALDEKIQIPLFMKGIVHSTYQKMYDELFELNKAVERNKVDLIAAGLETEIIDRINLQLPNLKAMLDMPREGHTIAINARLEKENAMNEIMLILKNELDPLVQLLGAKNPEVMTNYDTARRWIKPTSSRRSSAKDANSSK